MSRDTSAVVAAALDYCQRGWRVVDLQYKSKNPYKKSWTELEYDLDEISDVFGNSPKNIGVILGHKSMNLVDVDIDCQEFKLLAQYLPETHAIFGRTGNHNSHRLYYITDEAPAMTRQFATSEFSVVELRGTGAQTMFPPSIHPNGESLYWIEDGEPGKISYDQLLNTLSILASATIIGKYWPNGSRHTATGALAGGLARQGWSQYNSEIFIRYILRVAGDDEIEDRLRYVRDTYASIGSNASNITGFNTLAQIIDSNVVDQVVKWLKLQPETSYYDRTDRGNKDRFIDRYGKDVIYSRQNKSFFIWNGKIWNTDITNETYRLLENVIEDIPKEIVQVHTKEEREAIWKHYKNSGDSRRIEGAYNLIAKLGKNVTNDNLDNDPDLYNVLNGTIHLPTGELRPHNKEDYITKLSPVEYDANTDCPIFMEFMDTTFAGNKELIDYILMALGYSLTGRLEEKSIFICHGDTNTGKTTFLNTILDITGNYGMQISQNLLDKKASVDNRPEISQLKGMRFTAASEPKDGLQLNESFVKTITGRNKVQGKALYGMPFTFYPINKLWIDTNFVPTMSTIDNAIRARIKIIPFNVQIPENKQDKQLYRKLRDEYNGIFSLIVKYAMKWYETGLYEPEIVTRNTREKFDEMDAIGLFIREKFVITKEEKDRISTNTFMNLYKLWCEDQGIFELHSSGSRQAFNKEIKKFEIYKKNARPNPGDPVQDCWIGIRLKTESELLS